MQDLKKVKDVHDGLRYMRSGIAALLRLGLRYEVDLKKWEVVVKIPKYIPHEK